MYETPEDLDQLQRVLDESHSAGGRHLRDIITEERRVDAAGLASRLDGMRLLVLATVTADGRPIAGPVDGVFYRGRFHFGSAPDSVRFRHIRARPAVSATHLPGEEFSVTVHGVAEEIDLKSPEHAGFRQALFDVYVPRYGDSWETFIDSGPVYARINPTKMFTFYMPEPPPSL
jgi:nitroimidazol reductase NimA-like FMN-containing flavoprotein (pyridoxamine 5'-phosphate oxidase superfamily)